MPEPTRIKYEKLSLDSPLKIYLLLKNNHSIAFGNSSDQ
ncbi:MAG: hypothetical protein RLZZ312_297 [Bacteroidota bacterium]|jgi:hypothetical protein